MPEAAFNGVGKSPHQPHFLSEALAGNLTSVRMKNKAITGISKILFIMAANNKEKQSQQWLSSVIMT